MNEVKHTEVKPNLEAPWYTYQKKLKALFEGDQDIAIGDIETQSAGGGMYHLPIEIKKHKKYAALSSLLPEVVDFGNVKLVITLYDEENNMSTRALDLVKDLFDGNPHVNQLIETEDVTGATHLYVQFKPEVLQFWADNMQSYNGLVSCIAEDVAEQCLEGIGAGIHFCTAPVEK